jgi:hypothetical protein
LTCTASNRPTADDLARRLANSRLAALVGLVIPSVLLSIASLVALSAALALCASQARADGDPASDVLLAQNVFYPYQPPVSSSMEAAMNRALAGAAHTGLNLKVAIIGSPEDLGADPRFFGYPARYAHYLDREISFNFIQPLLVVMPAGFATVAAGPPGALQSMRVDRSHASYGLTRSAILAVVALARANGHPIAAPAIPPYSSAGGSTSALVLFGLPLALLALAGALAALHSGAATGQERPQGPPPI